MYRIHFNEVDNRFVIQILRYWFFWRTVKTVKFETYKEALDYVKRIGLSELYRDRSANMYNAYISAA